MASNTLFVSNFPFTTTEDELRSTFEPMGAIQSVRIIVDRETGRRLFCLRPFPSTTPGRDGFLPLIGPTI